MDDEPHPAWIEKVVGIAAALGMNPTRLRWKLIRWNERRRRARRDLAQTLEQPGRSARRLWRRLGLTSPEAVSVSTLLALAIMAAYARVFVAQGGGFGAPSSWLLYDFGAQWPAGSSEPWRLVTPMFLHIGIWHLAFNLIAIATIGPQVEALYGRLTMLFVFIATGVLANVASGLIQPDVLSAGASGGLCGLIGAAAGYGQRIGTTGGRSLRNDMLKWIGYTIVFGFAVGANNWAHAFGALAGAAFGYTVPPRVWNRRGLAPVRFAAKLLGIAATVGALAIILTRTPEDHEPTSGENTMVEDYRFELRVCAVANTGATTAAQQLMDVRHDRVGAADRLVIRDVDTLCTSMATIRDGCKAGTLANVLPPGEDADTLCEVIERAAIDAP